MSQRVVVLVNAQVQTGIDSLKVKVSSDDSNSNFLENKISEGNGLTVTTINPGGDEQVQITVDETEINHDQLLNFEVDEHRPLNDGLTTTTNLWSADKIQTELNDKVDAVTPITDNTLIKSIGTSGTSFEVTGIIVDDSNNVQGINDLIVTGDLTVNGTTTSVNTDTLDVQDANITVNVGGDQSSADLAKAGLTVEMSDATDAVIGYNSITTSKFVAGEAGDTREIITTSHTQTLSNKTIDSSSNTITINADEATVQNLEVDNLKSGVLDTDLSDGTSVSHDTLASALAIKTYVDALIETVNEASEISYDNTTSGLTATDVQAAIDEVEARVDTAETNISDNATAISDHLADTVDAHDASAISYDNATSGLTATDAQAAIDELENEIDTVQSDLSNHIADTSTHGVAGDIVGTTDSQTLTNKTINATNNTINNLDTTNLASGVLDTDISTTSGSHDTLPSALAVKTYVDNSTPQVIFDQVNFSGVENAVGADVTGVSFSNATYRGVSLVITAVVDATTNSYAIYRLDGIQTGSDWVTSLEFTNGIVDLSFDIDTTGQLIYSSGSYAGFNSLDISVVGTLVAL